MLIISAIVFLVSTVATAFVSVDEVTDDSLVRPTIEQFKSLRNSDQVEFVRTAFEHRLEHSANISYEVSVVVRNHRIEDGRPGEIVWTGAKYRYRHWQLSNSYRMDTDQYESPDESAPFQMVRSGFDSETGRARSRVSKGVGSAMAGRIDTRHELVIEDNRYAYWLVGNDGQGCDQYLFQYLIEHAEEYSVEAAEQSGLIQLTVPWYPGHSLEKSLGTRRLWLDPEKRFMPVKGQSKWEKSPKSWRTEDFVVHESKLVGDVWMPIVIEEVIDSSNGPADVNHVWTTTVSKIEHGTVTPDDLIVDFPANTFVVDAIEGVSYTVGEDGKPTKQEPLYVGTVLREQDASSQRPKSSRFWLIVGNCLVILLVGSYYFLRKSKTTGRTA